MFFVFFLVLICYIVWIYFFYRKKGFLLYSRYWLPNIFLFLSFLISFFSFLTFGLNYEKNLKTNSSNMVFVLDVSKSMKALDYEDKSRLEVAKEFIKNYILEHDFNKNSLVIFSKDAVWVLPLTSDKDLFLTILSSQDEKSILKWWTNFLDAFNEAYNRLSTEENGWAVVFVSDFETNLSSWEKTTLLQNIWNIKQKLDKKNIKVYSVWVWNVSWNKIIVWYDMFWNTLYMQDDFWKDVVTKFDKDFFDSFSSLLSADKHIIKGFSSIKDIVFKNVPYNESQINQTLKGDYSRYLMIIAFLSFLIYLFLFSYFDKKWR